MYKENPVFVQPKNLKVKVWRYMDFTKLVSLIDSQSLYFTRLDKFDDPFEGSWPKINLLARKHSIEDIFPKGKGKKKKATDMSATMTMVSQTWRRHNAINCWHMNEHESAAMWRLYLSSSEGIAVQSTYLKLRDSFIEDECVHLGVVKYIDYENEVFERFGDILLSPIVHKRKSFEHEREVRALVTKRPPNVRDLAEESIGHGLRIKVDLKKLIERIYIAPTAPTWFADLVRSLIHKFGYRFEVVHSKLNEQPVF